MSARGVRDDTYQRVYTINQKVFKEYYELCSYVEKEVLKISSGFNKNTTVTRAISGINKILTDHYRYDNEKNIYDLYWFFKTKNHRGVCASYSKFAFAVLGKCGYEAIPCVGYTGKDPVHSINKTIINGKTYYCDFCWDSVEKTTNYLYMNISEMNSMKDHQTPKPDDCGIKIKITNDSRKAEPVKIKKCSNSKAGKIKLEYSRIPGVTGYMIQYGTDKTFNNNKVTKKTYTNQTKKTLTKLKKGKIYYIRVRSYKKSIKNSKITYYGNWSKVKKVKISK